MYEEGLFEAPRGEANLNAFLNAAKLHLEPFTISGALIKLHHAGLLKGLEGDINRESFVQAMEDKKQPEQVVAEYIERDKINRRTAVHILAQGSRDPQSNITNLPIELLGKIANHGFFSSNEHKFTDKISDINDKKKNNSPD